MFIDNALIGDHDVHIVALYGDVDGDGNLTLTDALWAKDDNDQPLDQDDNYRFGVDVDANITLTDFLLAKDQNAHAVTCP